MNYSELRIPSAVSIRETRLLQRLALGKKVIEAGALLGYSTVSIARTAREVVSIDHHRGYGDAPNDTFRDYLRNLDIYGVKKKISPVVDDFRALGKFIGDVVFIDLDGTYLTTLEALRLARAPIVCVHDFGRQNCGGVERAVLASGLSLLMVEDTLAVLSGKVQKRSPNGNFQRKGGYNYAKS